MSPKQSFAFFNKMTFFLLLLILTGLAFMIYSHFLVDYSLSNLEMTLRYAESPINDKDPIKRNIYAKVLEDLSLERAGATQSLEESMILRMSSESLSEQEALAPKEKAAVYLSWFFKKKKSDNFLQSAVLKAKYRVDNVLKWFRSISNSSKSLLKEERNLGFLLLEKAVEQERKWQFKRAEKMYRKYLSLYPLSSTKGFVMIALAQNLIRQQKWDDAKVILAKVQAGSWTEEEISLASNLMSSIKRLEKTQVSIGVWEKELLTVEMEIEKNRLLMLIGVACLSSFQLEKAKSVFLELEATSRIEEKGKAQFYLGWIHYLRSNEKGAEDFFQQVIQSTDADSSVNYGAKILLASQYAEQKNYGKSLALYADSAIRRNLASQTWNAIAELEQSSIYFNHLHDFKKGKEHLKKAGELLGEEEAIQNFANTIQGVANKNLRVFAFEALKHGQVHLAWDLFKKHLSFYPNDAWALSGLASVHYLMNDLMSAKQLSEKAYGLQKDEYTASLKAYVLAMGNNKQEAIRIFEEALTKNNSYIPALYNLSTLWLQDENKEKHLEAVRILKSLENNFKNQRNLMASKITNNLGCGLMVIGLAEEAFRRFAAGMKEDFKKRVPEIKHNYDFLERQLTGSSSGKPGLAASK